MIPLSKHTRTIIPRGRTEDSNRVKMCTEQDVTMFKDPVHVHKWMATTATDGSNMLPGSDNPLLSMNQIGFVESYPRFYGQGSESRPLDFTTASYDEFLHSTDFPTTFVPINSHSHSDSFSSEDDSVPNFRYDIPGSADMAYTKSNQSAVFPSDFSTSSGIACSAGPYVNTSYSAPTAWSSPSSAAMDPPLSGSYGATAFLSCSMTSPQALAASADFRFNFPDYDDVLPAPIMHHQVRSAAEFCSNDPCCPSTIRPVRDHARGSLTDNLFWTPAGPLVDINPQGGGLHYGPNHPGKQGSTHVNARDHHLYHVEANLIDNLYYCPFGETEQCRHKPEKLKCNYDKHLDSHLKPYRCKHNACSSVPFSSTACLLRHEREAHGMHGHGSNPFRCPYSDCDRGRGFPRRYNLEDHMRRMHKFEPSPNTRRKAAPGADASKTTTARNSKRRSTTSAVAFAPMEHTTTKANKSSSTRAPGTTRRKSMQ